MSAAINKILIYQIYFKVGCLWLNPNFFDENPTAISKSNRSGARKEGGVGGGILLPRFPRRRIRIRLRNAPPVISIYFF
jgi:hypothetical protein